MCLATPVKVIEINGQKAIVQSGNHTHSVDLSIVENVQIGDYVLAHGELIIQKLPKDEAEKILGMINTLSHEHHYHKH